MVDILAKISYFSTAQKNGKAYFFHVFRAIFTEKIFRVNSLFETNLRVNFLSIKICI